MENNFWENKKILVTGRYGFLGSYVMEKLKDKSVGKIIFPKRKDYDLTNGESVKKLFRDNPGIDVVIHMAVDGGGIGYMKGHPGIVFDNNILMNTFVQKYAREAGVGKFVGIGSVCGYPKITPVPFSEDNLWDGFPEETNAPYGLVKKMMLVQSQAYLEQFGFDGIHLMPVNLYGPRDDFDLSNGHVIPALIRKIVEAKRQGLQKVEVWGTGKASREFLYVEDCAEAIVKAAEKYSSKEPINIGSGGEITIKNLAEKIVRLTNFNGELKWDITKPDGQPRRLLDVSRAKREFGFKAKTSLDEGLKKTIDWYVLNRT